MTEQERQAATVAALLDWVITKNTMSNTTFDLAAIQPGRGQKYSPNLYRWLRKYGATFKNIYLKDGLLWIGFKDEHFNGVLLNEVLCKGFRARTGWFYFDKADDWQEVPDFWERYNEVGRCAIDPEHKMSFTGDCNRWAVKGDTRHCRWCGECAQFLHKWNETVERQGWKNVP